MKFAIDQVLNRRSPDFESELFYNLNILQENIGAAFVYEGTATLQQYQDTVRVDWEILPPGALEDIANRILQGKSVPAQDRSLPAKEKGDRLLFLVP